MDIHFRSKLKDVGLLANPFHLYGWLDDNKELCQRHGAPNKVKMDGRNDESMLLEDSRGIALPKHHIMSNNQEVEDSFSIDLGPTIDEESPCSEFEMQPSTTEASQVETSQSTSSTGIEDLLAHISELQTLLAQKEMENKQIADENRILKLTYKKIQKEKEMAESHTEMALASNEQQHLLELKEYKIQLKNRQDKINTILAENGELKKLLAKQQAEYQQIASENVKLVSRIAQFKREKEMTTTRRETVKTHGKHLGVLQECNVQVRQKQDKMYASDRRNRTEPPTRYPKTLNASAKVSY